MAPNDLGKSANSRGSGGGVPLALEGSRTLRYAVLRAANPGWSKRRCARAAGYPPTTSTYSVEQSGLFAAAQQQISQYREHLRSCPDVSLGSMVAHLAGIVTATETGYKRVLGKGGVEKVRRVTEYVAPPRDRVAAIKQASAMLGYDAPQQVEANVRGLIVELSSYASADLTAVRAALAEGA